LLDDDKEAVMSAIEVDHLVKRYGDSTVVNDVSFAVEEGEIFGILGPNGAGKTTIAETIEGLRRPDEGTIRVLGLDPRRDAAEVRERLGAQLQESRLPDKLRVWEAMDLFASFYRESVPWPELLERLGLARQRDARYKDLSGGQKQRLSAALALVGSPQIAVLDELTTGLDPQARRATWELIEQIRDDGVTVVLVTHFMEEAERLSDRVALIDDGRLVAIDTPARLVSRNVPESTIRFRPSSPFDTSMLTALPEVTAVRRHGTSLVVTGTDDVLQVVTAVLARNRIVAEDLRLEQANLDDAYVALTGGPHPGAEDGALTARRS
jgi:ABC-2 type transport system ATP-binding protein